MLVRYPDYYTQFSCIADKCEDTCCAGWEIDIDEASYLYYQNLPGAFGEKVRACTKRYEEETDAYESHGFVLREDRRCPFLQDDGLCEMILALGEDALCDVCTYTPRNFLEYGGMREISISPSCAEAGRLIFGSEEITEFVTGEEAGKLDIEESREEILFGQTIRTVRDYALSILQERKFSVSARMGGFLCFGWEVQQRLNEEETEHLAELCCRSVDDYIAQREHQLPAGETSPDASYDSFLRRLMLFSGLDSINEEWEKYLQDMNTVFVESEYSKKNYREAMKEYDRRLKEEGREFEWEHLAVYFAFLMLSRCVDDWNIWGKVQFVVVSWLFVRDMDALRYFRTGRYTVEDRVDVMRIYAKEVEHSQENLDNIQEEFLFGDTYCKEKLLAQLTDWEEV